MNPDTAQNPVPRKLFSEALLKVIAFIRAQFAPVFFESQSEKARKARFAHRWEALELER